MPDRAGVRLRCQIVLGVGRSRRLARRGGVGSGRCGGRGWRCRGVTVALADWTTGGVDGAGRRRRLAAPGREHDQQCRRHRPRTRRLGTEQPPLGIAVPLTPLLDQRGPVRRDLRRRRQRADSPHQFLDLPLVAAAQATPRLGSNGSSFSAAAITVCTSSKPTSRASSARGQPRLGRGRAEHHRPAPDPPRASATHPATRPHRPSADSSGRADRRPRAAHRTASGPARRRPPRAWPAYAAAGSVSQRCRATTAAAASTSVTVRSRTRR